MSAPAPRPRSWGQLSLCWLLLWGLTTVRADTFLVTNAGDNTISKYDAAGNYLGSFATTGMNSPSGLAFSTSGNLLVANGNNTVSQYNGTTGEFVGIFASTGMNLPEYVVAISAPVISPSPGNQTATVGGSATFAAAASGLPQFQWQRKPAGGAFANLTNGGNFAGATSATLTINGATLALNGDQYRCVVRNLDGSDTSAPATLVVRTIPVSISKQPASVSAKANATVKFTVQAAGTGPLKYQWRRNGSALKNSSHIAGATTVTVSLKKITTKDAGNYTVLVTGAAGSHATSKTAKLTVKK